MPRGHVGCGGILKANGRAPRRVVTLAGEVGLSRRRYRCGACGGRGRAARRGARPGAPGAAHPRACGSARLWLVTELSYAKAARTLDELRAIGGQPRPAPPLGRPRRVPASRPRSAARTEALLGAHPERDPQHAGAWRATSGSAPTARWSTTAARAPTWRSSSGSSSRAPSGPARDRRAPARPAPTSGAPGRGPRSRNASPRPVRRWASTRRERILFVSDGAAAIRWIRERSFPDAVELLDWYHLTEQLRFGIGRQHEAVLSTALGSGHARRCRGPPGHPAQPCPLARAGRSRAGPPLSGRHRLRREQPARHRQLPHRAPRPARDRWRRASTSPSAGASRPGA